MMSKVLQVHVLLKNGPSAGRDLVNERGRSLLDVPCAFLKRNAWDAWLLQTTFLRNPPSRSTFPFDFLLPPPLENVYIYCTGRKRKKLYYFSQVEAQLCTGTTMHWHDYALAQLCTGTTMHLHGLATHVGFGRHHPFRHCLAITFRRSVVEFSM